MNTIIFDCSEWPAKAAYGSYACDQTGDNSGEYVPLSVAVALLTVLEELDECAEYWSEYDVPLGLHDRIKAATKQARGE